MTPDQLALSVTRVIALATLLRPDLANRGTREDQRRIAAECLLRARRDQAIPRAFRDAFDDR